MSMRPEQFLEVTIEGPVGVLALEISSDLRMWSEGIVFDKKPGPQKQALSIKGSSQYLRVNEGLRFR